MRRPAGSYGRALNHDLFRATIALAKPGYLEEGLIGWFQPRSVRNENKQRTLFRNCNERPMSNPIAFVLLDRPITPEIQKLIGILRQRHPDLAWDVAGDSATAKADAPLLILCGGNLVTVMSMPAPLPHEQGLWVRASKAWPEAQNVAGHHRAHLIVSMIGTSEDKVQSSRLTTAVVGGVIAVTSGCCAVVWRTLIARSAEMWLEASNRAFAPFADYPFMLWVDIIPFPSGQTIGAITVGLSAFADREIEFEVDGMDHSTAIDRVAGLAVYLIEHGSVIKDGDTIGISEADRIKVHYRTSRFTGSPVITVGSERPTPGRRQFYPIIPASIARDHPLLIMLGKAGLFDAAGPENQIQLRPDAYVSEVRLESYDRGTNGVLSDILGTDAYIEADEKARRALTRGDAEMAKSALLPFAEEIKKFQATARYALTRGDLFMFQPR
jgi:uncharacterized protein DUF4261